MFPKPVISAVSTSCLHCPPSSTGSGTSDPEQIFSPDGWAARQLGSQNPFLDAEADKMFIRHTSVAVGCKFVLCYNIEAFGRRNNSNRINSVRIV